MSLCGKLTRNSTMNNVFVFDTYALIEIVRGNPEYRKYESATAVINHFIFSELCYNVLKGDTVNAADVVKPYRNSIVIVSPKQIFDAMIFRHRNKKKDLSMADCVSYIQAQSRGIPFLTGDRQFKGMPGVEFVK